MVQARTFEQIMQFSKESVYGTPVAPANVIPVTGGGITPQNEEIFDEGRRGVPSATFAAYQGPGHGEASVEGFAYPDRIGHFLLAMFGIDNASGAGPYTHVFNNVATPPGYTFEDAIMAGAAGGMRMAGSRCGALNFSFDASTGVLAYTSTWMGMIPTKVTPAAVTLVAPANAWPGWTGVVTSTGLTSRIISGDINITKELQVINTATNTRSPRTINPGPMQVEGTFTLATEDLSDFDLYLADTQQPFSIVFTSGINIITFQMTLVTFAASPIGFARDGVSVNDTLSYRAIHNTTDGPTSGPTYALGGPAKVTLVNSTATY